MSVQVEAQFDPNTFTLTYIVFDPDSKDTIVIDPVLDYDAASGKIAFDSIKKIKSFITEKELNLKFILETHAHADHLTGSQELKKLYPMAKVGINKNIKLVQMTFKEVFNLKELAIDGSQFDILLNEQEALNVGSFEVKTIFTPGHTPACSSFLIEDNLFTGDAIFMPDSGTGRCDFPKGSGAALYESIHSKLYRLPDATKVFVGHDYQPGGRELKYQTTIKEEKENNIQLKAQTSRDEYVEFRTKRDATLNAPKLLLPSIQVNINAGNLPVAEDNGMSYLKLPISE